MFGTYFPWETFTSPGRGGFETGPIFVLVEGKPRLDHPVMVRWLDIATLVGQFLLPPGKLTVGP